MTDITQLLSEVQSGSREAMDRLLPLVYNELRALAAKMMNQERPDHTLQATALVHEAYLKLVDQTRTQWRDKAHFFALAAQAIRRILVDHARSHGRIKRGAGRSKLTLDGKFAASPDRTVDLLALDEALRTIAAKNPEQVQIVEMRFFAGLSLEETAAVLKKSTRTVEREWRYVRALLFKILESGDESPRGEDR